MIGFILYAFWFKFDIIFMKSLWGIKKMLGIPKLQIYKYIFTHKDLSFYTEDVEIWLMKYITELNLPS